MTENWRLIARDLLMAHFIDSKLRAEIALAINFLHFRIVFFLSLTRSTIEGK
jgi:hypothetical protein